MIQAYLVWSTLALSFTHSLAFSPSNLERPPVQQFATPTTTSDEGPNEHHDTVVGISRKEWVSQVVATMSATLIGSSSVANAEEDAAAAPPPPPAGGYSIEKCSTGSKNPCVSTANVRQLDLYIAPWTFEKPVDEVMSRLKGAIVTDSNSEIVKQEGNKYLKVEAKRIDLFGTVDELEFVISEKDQVITFRSAATNDSKDFGAMKKRFEEIRKRAGIFGVMGESLNTADSASMQAQGYGPLGQLKAFYGLQSGAGFEEINLE